MEALPEAISWCEVSAEAIRANLAILRRGLSQGTELGIVVKSNAYGHGLAACAGVFVAAGADWPIVNSVGEAYCPARVGSRVAHLCLRTGVPR